MDNSRCQNRWKNDRWRGGVFWINEHQGNASATELSQLGGDARVDVSKVPKQGDTVDLFEFGACAGNLDAGPFVDQAIRASLCGEIHKHGTARAARFGHRFGTPWLPVNCVGSATGPRAPRKLSLKNSKIAGRQ